MRLAIAAITTAVMLAVLAVAYFTSTPVQPAQPQRQWIKLIFGADGKSASWDGKLQIENGRILQMVDWQFEERDKINAKAKSWKITTGIPKKNRVTFAEPQRGLLVEIAATPKTVLHVQTKQGDCQINPSKLTPGRPTKALNGRATVEPLGSATLAAKSDTDDDFASITVDNKGHRHVLWIAYDSKQDNNQLLIRNVDASGSKPRRIAKAKEFASPHLLTGKDGKLRAVYCSPGNDKNWDIFLATNEKNGWQVQRVTTAKGTDFHLAVAQGNDGALWLAWQSFRDGNGDIVAQCLRDGRWHKNDIPVATLPANEWQPAISVDAAGKAWIAYDSYENGNYDVFLTNLAYQNGAYRQGKKIAVAQAPDFEAHASVLAEGANVWVAYDAAGPNWGRDFHNIPTSIRGKYAEPLHASRRLELRCVKNGKVYQPKAVLPQILPPSPIKKVLRKPTTKPSRFYEFPQLARDGDGRMWILFRQCRQGYCGHPPRGIHWMICATAFTNKGWLEPIELPKSQGRQNQRVAFAIGNDKRLHCAWADGCRFASVNRKYGVYFGKLPAIHEHDVNIPLKPANVGVPSVVEKTASPNWTIAKNGKTYHLYYGDLHRHTNISRCSPTIDGSLTDAHRYALDAVQLDFLAITDHTRDVDPFSWWRTQQAADHFHIPGRYVPIYAYERSNGTAMGGHRNVFFTKRGWKVNPSDHWYLGRGLKVKDTNPYTTLYPWLKKRDALTAAHTPGYSRAAKKGTWTYHDPQVEPVAEIFQAFRRSYERPGKGVAEEATLWHALQKGHKLGFIASSDHISTHSSYACIWATEKTREALFEGLRSRRTFAATDRIVLDVRIGNAVLGEETKADGKTVTLKIRVRGTAPVDEIQIIRSGQVAARLQPGKRQVQTEYVDRLPLPGESYYYVRINQRDGGRAWGSPIWVNR